MVWGRRWHPDAVCDWSIKKGNGRFFFIYRLLLQTSKVTLAESNAYLGRPKWIKFNIDSDVELNVYLECARLWLGNKLK